MVSLQRDNLYGRPLGLPGKNHSGTQMTNFRHWVNPDVVVSVPPSGADAATSDLTYGGVRVPEDGPKVTFETLIENYIDGRREAYLEAGWALFKEGRYREATDQFSLADSVSVDDIGYRAEVKSAQMIGGMATGQYSMALHSLAWLLGEDSRSEAIRQLDGQLVRGGRMTGVRQPDLLRQLPTVNEIYLSTDSGRSPDYERHLTEISLFAARNPTGAEGRVMKALLLWMDESQRELALVELRPLNERTDTPPMWRNLYQLMEMELSATRDDLGFPPDLTRPVESLRGTSEEAIIEP